MKDIKIYFRLAAESGRVLKSHAPSSWDEFLNSVLVQDAINMRLQVIGENLSRVRSLDPEIYERYADQSWNELIGLRNSISHGYNQLKTDVIWNVASNLIDPLITQFEHLADPSVEL